LVIRAGFVITCKNADEDLQLLGCHPTGSSHDRFDLPKGCVHSELKEPVFIAAVRELFEETGITLTLSDLFDVKDLGIFEYGPSGRDRLHLFHYHSFAPIELYKIKCSSLIENAKQAERNGLPEHDGFELLPQDSSKWFDSIGKILKKVILDVKK